MKSVFMNKERSVFFFIAIIVFAVLIVLWVSRFDKKLMVGNDKYFSVRLSINDMLGLSSNRISFYGDSMIAGVSFNTSTNTVDQVYSWGDDFSGAEVHGISGATLEVVLSKLRQAKPLRGKAVIIFAGFNNIKHSDQSVEEIATQYAGLFDRATLMSDNVLCVAVPPMFQEKSMGWYPEGGWIGNDRIRAVNFRISQICGRGFVDTDKMWESSDSDDGIHPSRLGYKKISSEIMKKLATF